MTDRARRMNTLTFRVHPTGIFAGTAANVPTAIAWWHTALHSNRSLGTISTLWTILWGLSSCRYALHFINGLFLSASLTRVLNHISYQWDQTICPFRLFCGDTICKKLSHRWERGRQTMYFFVARLLSIAVITETCVRHVRNLRPINRMIYYTHTSNKIKLRQCTRNSSSSTCGNARPHYRLTSPVQRTPSISHESYIAIESLSYMSVAGSVSLSLLCTRPIGRFTRLARRSVRPSVYLSVCAIRLRNSKTKQEAQLLLGWPTVLPYSRRLCKSCVAVMQIGPTVFS